MNACGEIVIFTDDDAIAPYDWIRRYVALHQAYGDNIACISSRDIYVDPSCNEIRPTPDDSIRVRFYRWLVRPWRERPHPMLKKYRLGVYVTKSLKGACGPYIPSKTCYSLPFRGVNISFKGKALSEIEFPEHPFLKRALGNERYVGLQLVLKGWDSIYTPDNPIMHTMHESLSRSSHGRLEIETEVRIMKSMYARLLTSYKRAR
jgi:hypothetical protein